MKQCTSCKQFFPATIEFFHKSHIQSSGLHPRCKFCRAKERSIRYEKDGEIERAQMREYAKEHSKEAVKRVTQWKKQNPDKLRVNAKNYRQNHKEQGRINCTNRQARLANAEGFHNADDIQEIFEHQNGLCFYCKKELVEYDVDHFIPITKGGSNFKDNLVIACPHCNRSKGTKLPQDFRHGNWIK